MIRGRSFFRSDAKKNFQSTISNDDFFNFGDRDINNLRLECSTLLCAMGSKFNECAENGILIQVEDDGCDVEVVSPSENCADHTATATPSSICTDCEPSDDESEWNPNEELWSNSFDDSPSVIDQCEKEDDWVTRDSNWTDTESLLGHICCERDIVDYMYEADISHEQSDWSISHKSSSISSITVDRTTGLPDVVLQDGTNLDRNKHLIRRTGIYDKRTGNCIRNPAPQWFNSYNVHFIPGEEQDTKVPADV